MVILTTTEAQIPGYVVSAYKGVAQAETWTELLRHAEALGANAVLNTCFDDALDVDTLFHGAGVVLKPLKLPFAWAARSTPPEIEIRSHVQGDR